MRILVPLTVLLCSCSVQPVYPAPQATLEFRGLVNPYGVGGIVSISPENLTGGAQVGVTPGEHKIVDGCPGHESPTISFLFKSGIAYEMACDNGHPVVRAKQ